MPVFQLLNTNLRWAGFYRVEATVQKGITVLNSGQKYWWSQSFRYYSLLGTKRACCRCCWVAVILLFSICPCIQLLVANSYLSMVALYGICLIWPIYGVPIQKWQELHWRWEGGGELAVVCFLDCGSANSECSQYVHRALSHIVCHRLQKGVNFLGHNTLSTWTYDTRGLGIVNSS